MVSETLNTLKKLGSISRPKAITGKGPKVPLSDSAPSVNNTAGVFPPDQVAQPAPTWKRCRLILNFSVSSKGSKSGLPAGSVWKLASWPAMFTSAKVCIAASQEARSVKKVIALHGKDIVAAITESATARKAFFLAVLCLTRPARLKSVVVLAFIGVLPIRLAGRQMPPLGVVARVPPMLLSVGDKTSFEQLTTRTHRG